MLYSCKGNYNTKNKVFKIPRNEEERSNWLTVICSVPSKELWCKCRQAHVFHLRKALACKSFQSMLKLPGGTRPTNPSSIFDVPSSCLPSPRPSPRRPKKDLKLRISINLPSCRCVSYFSESPLVMMTVVSSAWRMTDDTKRALVQTMQNLASLSKYLWIFLDSNLCCYVNCRMTKSRASFLYIASQQVPTLSWRQGMWCRLARNAWLGTRLHIWKSWIFYQNIE